MNYESLSSFAQTWGLLYFVILFAAAVAYALWPSKKKEFERAAHMPLIDEEPLK